MLQQQNQSRPEPPDLGVHLSSRVYCRALVREEGAKSYFLLPMEFFLLTRESLKNSREKSGDGKRDFPPAVRKNIAKARLIQM